MALLSTGAHLMSGAVVHLDHSRDQRLVRHVTDPHVLSSNDVDADMSPVTSPAQTVSLANTTTNFANEPLSPVLNLFDPSLGTLLSVTVSHTATVQSSIVSQNLSPSSGTVITAGFTGTSEIDGLNQPILQPSRTLISVPMRAGPFGSGSDTVAFPPIVLTDSSSTTFTDPTSLAFFTGSSGRSTTTLTMTASGIATASAPNGNLLTTSVSGASSSVTVTYTYQPVCPTVSGIGRIGVHHQETKLVLTFDGTVDPAKADNPGDYSVIRPSGKTIPIKSATFDPATNAVTLVPAVRLNVHYHFKLSVVIPCPNETGETVIVPFGGKDSLIGFHNHKGEFVSVQNGRITGFDNRQGQFIPVHHDKVERVKVKITPRSHDRSEQTATPFSQRPAVFGRRKSSG